MLTLKEKKKLWKLGYKLSHSKLPTQDEYDLKMVNEIKNCSVNGKIGVARTDQFFYDTIDYAVDGYDSTKVDIIPASYTAFRHYCRDAERCADSPYSLKIVRLQN